MSSLLRRLVRAVEQRVGDGGAVDDVAGQVAEPLLAGTGVRTEQGERLSEVDLAAFSEYTLGVFDDHAAVERGLAAGSTPPPIATQAEAGRGTRLSRRHGSGWRNAATLVIKPDWAGALTTSQDCSSVSGSPLPVGSIGGPIR
jgi:hypothetical protein